MKVLLRTIGILQLLEDARTSLAASDAPASEVIAQCQALIAQAAGCPDRAVWSALFHRRDEQRDALAACMQEVESAGHEILTSCPVSFDVKPAEGAEDIQSMVSRYPALGAWTDEEWGTWSISVQDIL